MKNGKSGFKGVFKTLSISLLSVALTALFMLVLVFAVAGKGRPSGAFIAFITVCACIAGLIPAVLSALKSRSDEKIISDAIEELYKGNYNAEIPAVGYKYKPLKQAIERLSDVLAAIDKTQVDFINDFSHELKTPVTSIRGFARLLKNGGLKQEEIAEYSAIIAEQSDRLLDLTANTLMLDRLGAKNLNVEKSVFDVSEVVRKVALSMQESWESKDIDLEVNADYAEVKSNEELVFQMVSNVFENAVKYTPAGKKITLSTENTPDGVCVIVADEGIGMTKETTARMFDRYYRADKSRSTAGNGLGLSTVKKIAEILNVKISVESAPDVGTTFKFSFSD